MHSLLRSTLFLAIASLSVAYDGNLMLTMVNKERSNHGVKALRLSEILNKAAQTQSDDQARRRRMGHDGSDGSSVWNRCKRAGYPTERCGENVAWNYKDETHVMKGWMDSPGHRKNILSPDYLEFGSAVAVDSSNAPYHTQVFGNPNPWGYGDNRQSPSPAPAPTPTPAPAPRPSPAPAPFPSPAPAPGPTPAPAPFPGPAPAPAPGPTPAPGPAPAPAPFPGPAPAPGPVPVPTPGPAPAPGPVPRNPRSYSGRYTLV